MSGKLHFDYDITHLQGADYNPRKISDRDIEILGESIKTLGMVKPLIVRNNILVAGHQRTKALKSIGVETAPVYLLSTNTTVYDEVRFNQLHNGTDLDLGVENCFVKRKIQKGFQFVEPNEIEADFNTSMAVVRKEIVRLIYKYGSWGSVVATTEGEVIHAAQYALAAKIANVPLAVYGVDAKKKDTYALFLNKTYGQFSYDNLPKHTYIQTFAQMYRLRSGSKKNKSHLYENFVLPWLKKHPKTRGIDFGSGQGDYAKHLRSQGYDLIDIELFRRKNNQGINLSVVNKMIDLLCLNLRLKGQFDYVVCDSVLNSTDCLKAEESIMKVLNLLCKQNGVVFFSGRPRERVDQRMLATIDNSNVSEIKFCDEHGFTASYRKGEWFYQKYHTKNQVIKLAKSVNFKIVKQFHTKHKASWRVMAECVENIPIKQAIAAIEYEFNLPISKTERLNRHEDLINIVKKIYANKMAMEN